MRKLALIGVLAVIIGVTAAVFFFGGFYSVAGTEEDTGHGLFAPPDRLILKVRQDLKLLSQETATGEGACAT